MLELCRASAFSKLSFRNPLVSIALTWRLSGEYTIRLSAQIPRERGYITQRVAQLTVSIAAGEKSKKVELELTEDELELLAEIAERIRESKK